MLQIIRCVISLLTLSSWMMAANAAVTDDYVFATPEQQSRFIQLTTELRCPQCQNQSIADSNATISEDLRREVFRLIDEGREDQDIIHFMHERYGDFVLYKPRLNAQTLLLWFGPLLLLILALGVLAVIVKRHRKTAQPGVLDTTEQAELDNILDGKQ